MTSSTMKSNSKNGKQRKSSSLPTETVEYLKAWMMSPEHIAHPYPTEPEKAKIMADTGIELKQLSNWFVNNRKRYWKPRVEARLQQQAQAAAAAAQAHAAAVAAVTAATHTNPVSPSPGSKNTFKMTPNTGFVTFDLGTPETTETKSYPHLVETDFASVLADQRSRAKQDSRLVSESSSSSSVSSTEEGDLSDAPQEDECSVAAVATSPVTPTRKALETQASGESSSSVVSVSQDVTPPPPSMRKRVHYQEEPVQTPRKKYRRISLDLWRDACQNANHAYDESLPSLEEATQLFGYVR
eukprot:scaffold1169_cov120-Cylindrotheca_fusiformis.AAC.13